ncbi:hypothetical protein [Prosthecochloris sp. HL-130-GSB]|uniref:hypothetical protein n=1 Tax=Prosthecochloris sp. HL-130-GSB TaxID=1974213 RepID=UPI001E5B1339|nr:hypothetical protein [Prosthecochloris sp. HL-130-GSB]
MKKQPGKSDITVISLVLIPFVLRVFFVSLFTNILVLAPSLYMLEVYDRVVNSRNYTTLLMLTLLVIGLYIMLETLEWVRRRHMHEGALKLDEALRKRVFHALYAARLQGSQAGGVQPLNDLRTIREFLPSSPFLSLFDIPWRCSFLCSCMLSIRCCAGLPLAEQCCWG